MLSYNQNPLTEQGKSCIYHVCIGHHHSQSYCGDYSVTWDSFKTDAFPYKWKADFPGMQTPWLKQFMLLNPTLAWNMRGFCFNQVPGRGIIHSRAVSVEYKGQTVSLCLSVCQSLPVGRAPGTGDAPHLSFLHHESDHHQGASVPG